MRFILSVPHFKQSISSIVEGGPGENKISEGMQLSKNTFSGNVKMDTGIEKNKLCLFYR